MRATPCLLSDRQREALRLKQRGITVPEIARLLGIERESAYQLLARAQRAYDQVRRLAADLDL